MSKESRRRFCIAFIKYKKNAATALERLIV